MEGPDDPQHFALFARDTDGKLIAVLHNNTSHPVTYFNMGVYTPDFPGRARCYLRETLGDMPVLFCNGAFGDICIRNPARRCSCSITRNTLPTQFLSILTKI